MKTLFPVYFSNLERLVSVAFVADFRNIRKAHGYFTNFAT